MVALCYHREVIEVQREKLESFTTLGKPLKRVRWQGDVAPSRPMGSQGGDGSESSDEDDKDWVMIDAATKKNTGLLLGDYVVSIVGRAKTKTLHRYGECYIDSLAFITRCSSLSAASCQRQRRTIEPAGCAF